MPDIKVRTWAAPPGSNYLASVSITLNNQFVITGIRIREGKYGRYITMPSKAVTDTNGTRTYADICYPWSGSQKKELSDIILKTYDTMPIGGETTTEGNDTETPELPFEVAVTPINGASGLLANIALNFDRYFVVEGVRLRQSWDKKNTYITMPSFATKTGEWKDYCYPVTPEFQKALKEGCIAAYKAELEKLQPEQSPKTI